MFLDFAALPPEINSGLMYAGPGSGPMMAAAAAWNNLGAELSTAAASYQSVISTLTCEEWLGPASAALAAAVQPYVAWISSTAVAVEHAASQATASAAAYETAFAMTVPPAVIAANRALLAALVATNFLGQNTPAIAANEAQYGEMWAQDATAMYGYQGSSASAATLNPLTSPAPTTNPSGPAGQAAAVTQAAASITLQNAAQGVASPMASPAASISSLLSSSSEGFLNDLVGSGGNIGIWNDAFNVAGAIGDIGSWNGFEGIAAGVSLGVGVSQHAAGAAAAGAAVPESLGTVLAGGAGPAGTGSMAGLAGAPVLAGLGQASSAGELSVPASWSAAAPASSAATLTGAGWTVPTDESSGITTVAAGMPAMASATRGGYGFGAPRYGVKPTVMPRPVVAG